MKLDWLEKDGQQAGAPSEAELYEAEAEAAEAMEAELLTLEDEAGNTLQLAILASWEAEEHLYYAVTDAVSEDGLEVFFLRSNADGEEFMFVNEPEECAMCCSIFTEGMGEEIIDPTETVYDEDFAAYGGDEGDVEVPETEDWEPYILSEEDYQEIVSELYEGWQEEEGIDMAALLDALAEAGEAEVTT